MNLGGTNIRWQYKNNATTCHILNDDQEIVSRTVKVRHNDLKEKQIGRFMAFRKSMAHLAEHNIIPKEQRTQMWNDFKIKIKSPIRVQNQLQLA